MRAAGSRTHARSTSPAPSTSRSSPCFASTCEPRIGSARAFCGLASATRGCSSRATSSASVAEDRLQVALYAKAELPAEVWLEGRLRSDLRWIGGDFSTRQRFRLEVNREFTVQALSVTPYLQVEAFYDTRYHGLSRMLYQPGVEIAIDSHFRLELYLARQDDRLPKRESLNALGLVAKWYY